MTTSQIVEIAAKVCTNPRFPLIVGIFLSPTEEEVDIAAGLGLLVEMLPMRCFGGCDRPTHWVTGVVISGIAFPLKR